MSDSTYIEKITTVPVKWLDAVGLGAAQNQATAIPGGKARIVDGHPQFLFVGAQFCPYCAMQRWPTAIALSRFGSFSGLAPSLSGADEGPASNIPTVDFTQASYRSDHLTFTGYEVADRDGNPLQQPSASDAEVIATYNMGGGVPFSFWGTGAQGGADIADFSAMAGKPGEQVYESLADASSLNAQQILGVANLITARLCDLVGGPEEVRNSPGVLAAAKALR